MTAFWVLLRQRIRRDRWTVSIWIVSTGALALMSAVSIIKTYGDDAARTAILKIAVTEGRAILLLRGLPDGSSIGAFTFFEIFTYLALMAAMMSTFLAVRHTRAEEESGRADMIAATPASRMAPLVATIVEGALANIALGILVALGFLAGGFDGTGSLVTGGATAAVGISFLAVGLLAAQFMRTSRGANTVSMSLIGLAFILRGIGDALGTASADNLHITSSWVSWLSPIGWAQHVGAYTTNAPLPLLINLAFAVVCVALVVALESQRDRGASLLAGRSGRATAPARLSSNFGLAWRLQWPTIVGWAIGGAALGSLAGGLTPLLRTVTVANTTVTKTLQTIAQTDGTVDETLIAAMFSIIGVLAAGCAIQSVMRLRQEEASGTAEAVLATPTSRVRWFVDYLAVGAVAIVIVLVSSAAVAAIAELASGGTTTEANDMFLSAAAQLPAAFIFLALLALIFVVLPGITIPLGWAAFGALTTVGIFGGLFGLPEWVRNLAPFTHTPVPFGTEVDWSGGIWMLGISIAAVAASTFLMRGRALHST